MKRILVWLPVLCFAANASGNDDVRERVEALIERSGAEVAVAFRTLDGTQELLIVPDKVYWWTQHVDTSGD